MACPSLPWRMFSGTLSRPLDIHMEDRGCLGQVSYEGSRDRTHVAAASAVACPATSSRCPCMSPSRHFFCWAYGTSDTVNEPYVLQGLL